MRAAKPLNHVVLVALLVILIGMLACFVIPTTAQTSCTFTATVDIEAIPLYGAPLVDDALIITYIPTQVAYPVAKDEMVEAMYFIQVDDTLFGWVDMRSGGPQGEDCPLFGWDYYPPVPPDVIGVCEFTITEPIPFYTDARLTLRMEEGPMHSDTLPPGGYVTTRRNAHSAYVYFGHAVGGGYIDLDDVTLNPECGPIIPPETLPDEPLVQATAVLGARLWTQPDVQQGQLAGFLTEGRTIHILSGPVSGVIRRDTLVEGNWYYVETPSGELSGWVWERRFIITED